jgi:hypothetical protein
VDIERLAAWITIVAPRTDFDLQLQAFEIGVARKSVETETQRAGIDSRRFANAHATFEARDPGWRRTSVATASRIELAIPISCISANPRELISGEHVDDAVRAESGAHRDQSRVRFTNSADHAGFAAKGMGAHRV